MGIHGFATLCPTTEDWHTKVSNFYFIGIPIFRAAFHTEFGLYEELTIFHDAWQLYILHKSPKTIIVASSSQEFRIWHMVTQHFSSPYIPPIRPLLQV